MSATDQLAISNLLANYSLLLDGRRFEEWGELFMNEATLTLGGDVLTGRELIRAGVMERTSKYPGMMHVTVNTYLELASDEASAVSNFFLVLPGTGGPMTISVAGRYTDALVRDGERWRFQSRRIETAAPAA